MRESPQLPTRPGVCHKQCVHVQKQALISTMFLKSNTCITARRKHDVLPLVRWNYFFCMAKGWCHVQGKAQLPGNEQCEARRGSDVLHEARGGSRATSSMAWDCGTTSEAKPDILISEVEQGGKAPFSTEQVDWAVFSAEQGSRAASSAKHAGWVKFAVQEGGKGWFKPCLCSSDPGSPLVAPTLPILVRYHFKKVSWMENKSAASII